MYSYTVRAELSLLHETILRVDIVVTNVAWESVKANFLVFILTCVLFYYLKDVSSKMNTVLDFS